MSDSHDFLYNIDLTCIHLMQGYVNDNHIVNLAWTQYLEYISKSPDCQFVEFDNWFERNRPDAKLYER